MPYAEIKCPHCSAAGRVDNDANSPFMMGRCPVCGGYVVYFCGASLGLEDGVIGTHSLETIRNHILARIDEFLEARLTEFLEEYAEEFEIDHERLHLLEADEEAEIQLEGEIVATQEDLGDSHVQPSIRQPDLGQITDQELRDFLEIDIHLIDRSNHFQRHFGA